MKNSSELFLEKVQSSKEIIDEINNNFETRSPKKGRPQKRPPFYCVVLVSYGNLKSLINKGLQELRTFRQGMFTKIIFKAGKKAQPLK